jgi:hypothetical protein
MLGQNGPETRFSGVSQAKWSSLGRLLIGEGDSFDEKTWFLCTVVNGYAGGNVGHVSVDGGSILKSKADLPPKKSVHPAA